SPFKQKFP
ncbi:hypothetical protein VCHENC02_0404B, partial [Vibrio harveyi]